MGHPLDGLVDCILRKAATEGRFSGLPDADHLIDAFRVSGRREAAALDPATRVRGTVVLLRDGIARAEHDLGFLPGGEARRTKVEEIAILRLRLASQVQAMDRGPRVASGEPDEGGAAGVEDHGGSEG